MKMAAPAVIGTFRGSMMSVTKSSQIDAQRNESVVGGGVGAVDGADGTALGSPEGVALGRPEGDAVAVTEGDKLDTRRVVPLGRGATLQFAVLLKAKGITWFTVTRPQADRHRH